MGQVGRERDGLAAPKEATQLHLAVRAAHLGDHRGGRPRKVSELQTDAMIGPGLAIVPCGGDEHRGVIDDAHADRVRAS